MMFNMWLTIWVNVVLMVGVFGIEIGNCRDVEESPRPCTPVCEKNNCTIRAALLLPANTSFDASLALVSFQSSIKLLVI